MIRWKSSPWIALLVYTLYTSSENNSTDNTTHSIQIEKNQHRYFKIIGCIVVLALG